MFHAHVVEELFKYVKQKEEKIINAVKKDKIPKNLNKIKQSLINHYKRPSHAKTEILNKLVNLIGNMPTIMQQADAGTQNEILVILLKNCTLNEQTLSYSLRSPFDKLIEADYHDWKDIIAHNFKELSSIEYNLKAINLKED